MNIQEELARVQKILKAPKGQWNNFSNYYYRSCEDIVEAVKLVTMCSVTLSDEVVLLGDRFYVKATVKITEPEGAFISCTGFAREAEIKKGMDASQITGSTSSYARKYALNGLFAIDDTRDSDSTNTSGEDEKAVAPKTNKPKENKNTVQQNQGDEKPWYNDLNTHKELMEKEIREGKKTADQIIKSLKENYKVSGAVSSQIKLLGG